MKTGKKILLSGVQSSGAPHIGNYLGAIKQFVDLQNNDEYQPYVFIANYHALTTIQDGKGLADNTLNLALDYLAAGLDPGKTVLYTQTSVPELFELTWIFNTLVTMPWLARAHAYKDKTAKGIEASVGLFDYPVLMAADILMAQADVVPVGKDQQQHVEMAREIAIKFNNVFGETFTIPREMISEDVAIVPGVDGQKMSKSYGNTIPLFGTDAEISKAVMSIVTDSKDPSDPKDPETDNLFALHKLLTPADQLAEIKAGYEQGGLGYGESKKILLQNILTLITPMRDKRDQLAKDLDYVRGVLEEGGKKMQTKAKLLMVDVRSKVGLV